MTGLVERAWGSFERAAVLRPRISPAVPILFFGDVDAYHGSPLRVLTVGGSPPEGRSCDSRSPPM